MQIVSELENKGALGGEIESEELMETLEAHHGAFGASVLRRWRFSRGYAEVAMWHDKIDDADPVSKELAVVHLVNLLVKTMGYGQTDEAPEIELETQKSAKILRVTDAMIVKTREEVKEIMDNNPMA